MMEIASNARVTLDRMNRNLQKPSQKQKAEMQNYERLLWVTEGFITYKRDLDALQKVAKDYQRIGLVPEGY